MGRGALPSLLAPAAAVLVATVSVSPAAAGVLQQAGDTVPAADTTGTREPSDTLRQEERAPERVGVEIPGYRATLRYLRSLRPVEAGPVEADTAPSGFLLDGLVVDETRTPLGSTFYETFYSAYSTPEGASGITIRVREQPVPGIGSQVAVFIDSRRLFQLRLPSRRTEIRSLARRAAAYTQQRVARRTASSSGAAGSGGGGG